MEQSSRFANLIIDSSDSDDADLLQPLPKRNDSGVAAPQGSPSKKQGEVAGSPATPLKPVDSNVAVGDNTTLSPKSKAPPPPKSLPIGARQASVSGQGSASAAKEMSPVSRPMKPAVAASEQGSRDESSNLQVAFQFPSEKAKAATDAVPNPPATSSATNATPTVEASSSNAAVPQNKQVKAWAALVIDSSDDDSEAGAAAGRAASAIADVPRYERPKVEELRRPVSDENDDDNETSESESVDLFSSKGNDSALGISIQKTNSSIAHTGNKTPVRFSTPVAHSTKESSSNIAFDEHREQLSVDEPLFRTPMSPPTGIRSGDNTRNNMDNDNHTYEKTAIGIKKRGASAGSRGKRTALYDRAVRHRALAEAKMKDFSAALQRVTEQECTFAPQITKRAKALRSTSAHSGPGTTPRTFGGVSPQRRYGVLDDPSEDTADHFPYAPEISKRSRQIVERRRGSMPGGATLDVHERLYSRQCGYEGDVSVVDADKSGIAAAVRSPRCHSACAVLQPTKTSVKRTPREIQEHVKHLHAFATKRERIVEVLRQEQEMRQQVYPSLCVDTNAVVERLLSERKEESAHSSRRPVFTHEQFCFSPATNKVSQEIVDHARERRLQLWYAFVFRAAPSEKEEGVTRSVDAKPLSVTAEHRAVVSGVCGGKEILAALQGISSSPDGALSMPWTLFLHTLTDYERQNGPQPWSRHDPQETVPEPRVAGAAELTFTPRISARSVLLLESKRDEKGERVRERKPAYERLFESAKKRQREEALKRLMEKEAELAEQVAAVVVTRTARAPTPLAEKPPQRVSRVSSSARSQQSNDGLVKSTTPTDHVKSTRRSSSSAVVFNQPEVPPLVWSATPAPQHSQLPPSEATAADTLGPVELLINELQMLVENPVSPRAPQSRISESERSSTTTNRSSSNSTKSRLQKTRSETTTATTPATERESSASGLANSAPSESAPHAAGHNSSFSAVNEKEGGVEERRQPPRRESSVQSQNVYVEENPSAKPPPPPPFRHSTASRSVESDSACRPGRQLPAHPSRRSSDTSSRGTPSSIDSVLSDLILECARSRPMLHADVHERNTEAQRIKRRLRKLGEKLYASH